MTIPEFDIAFNKLLKEILEESGIKTEMIIPSGPPVNNAMGFGPLSIQRTTEATFNEDFGYSIRMLRDWFKSKKVVCVDFPIKVQLEDNGIYTRNITGYTEWQPHKPNE